LRYTRKNSYCNRIKKVCNRRWRSEWKKIRDFLDNKIRERALFKRLLNLVHWLFSSGFAFTLSLARAKRRWRQTWKTGILSFNCQTHIDIVFIFQEAILKFPGKPLTLRISKSKWQKTTSHVSFIALFNYYTHFWIHKLHILVLELKNALNPHILLLEIFWLQIVKYHKSLCALSNKNHSRNYIHEEEINQYNNKLRVGNTMKITFSASLTLQFRSKVRFHVQDSWQWLIFHAALDAIQFTAAGFYSVCVHLQQSSSTISGNARLLLKWCYHRKSVEINFESSLKITHQNSCSAGLIRKMNSLRSEKISSAGRIAWCVGGSQKNKCTRANYTLCIFILLHRQLCIIAGRGAVHLLKRSW